MISRIQNLFKRFKYNNAKRDEAIAAVEVLYRKHVQAFEGTALEPYARTIAQYHGVTRVRTRSQIALRSLASLPLLARLLYQTVLRVPGPGSYPSRERVDGIKYESYREYETPPQLAHLDIRTVDPTQGALTWSEVKEIASGLWRAGCRAPEVYFRVLRDLGRLGHILGRFDPQFFLLYREYEYTSSLMTHYLRGRGLAVYDVMHGDMHYTLLNCFCSFDRFYIWHAGYQRMAEDMRAKIGEYVVYTPDRFRKAEEARSPKHDLLVLVPAYPLPPEDLESWTRAMKALMGRWRVILRPHPRYHFNDSVMDELKREYPTTFALSDPAQEPVLQAIVEARAIMGYASTVLLEAFHQGIAVACVEDRLLDEIVDYHPYFSDPAIHKIRVEDLAAGMDRILEGLA